MVLYGGGAGAAGLAAANLRLSVFCFQTRDVSDIQSNVHGAVGTGGLWQQVLCAVCRGVQLTAEHWHSLETKGGRSSFDNAGVMRSLTDLLLHQCWFR